MAKSQLELLRNYLEKAKVAYHEHDGFPEHPVAVKRHQEYFSAETPPHIPGEGAISRKAAMWLYKWSWKFSKIATLPSPEVAQFLHQFVPSEPVILYRFEQIDEPPGKTLVSYSYDKEMVEDAVRNANEASGKPVLRVKRAIISPKNILVDMTKVPWEKESLSEMDEVIVVRDPTFWEMVKLRTKP